MRKWLIIGGAIILVVLLGILVYFLIARKDGDEAANQSKLPKVWLAQHFGSEICSEEKCKDEADPDQDGLTNYNEFKEGTNPNNADTDTDGLADGDEINVYKTDPGLKYTDRREVAVLKDFNDAVDVAAEFDPLTPGIKMTEARLKQIEADTASFGLHEPTITTLKNLREKNSTTPKTYTIFIQNNIFDPAALVVTKGDTVVWLNKDAQAHQVMYFASSNFGGFQSPQLQTNQTFSYTFELSGVFDYEDQLNPAIKGKIEVK
ncbi:MAG: hypothetical protein HY395_03235 [Candidatus Doudnabacteria bacterium]|nr:hypothetical protein [Candidatus Doudnabacteria bacterium]